MEHSYCSQLELTTARATESEAEIEITICTHGQIVAVRGEVRGPRCSRCRTLAATFPIQWIEAGSEKQACARSLIVEPCYWTPTLPFLYDLDLELEMADGTTSPWQNSVGIKRWEAFESNLFRERRRVVLRGVCVESLSADVLEAAIEAEVSLLVSPPEGGLMAAASEMGVSLLVDLRGSSEELATIVARCQWHAAVDCVLFDSTFEAVGTSKSPPLKAQVIGHNQTMQQSLNAQVIVVELDGTATPPAWVSQIDRPVLAVRNGGQLSDFVEARRHCDRLQSDLAPQFDLAGYFV